MIPDATNANASEAPAQPLWQERDGAPGFAEAAANEFPEGATEFAGDEASRRTFIKLMGASAALASAGCYIRPAAQRKIHPYTTQPDELTPGLPNYYATATVHAGYGEPALVRQNEGRPTKIEGNPDHPSSLGGSSIHSQASILDVYDPDRSRTATRRGNPVGYETAIAALRGKLYRGNESVKSLSVRVLTETVTSPTLTAHIKALLAAFPKAKWVQYNAVGNESARKGLQTAYGRPVSVVYDFLKADVVLSLDADFTSIGPGAVRYSRDFADRRKIRSTGKTLAECATAAREPGKPFKEGVHQDALNRLYAVECMPTNTGAVADHRFPMRTAEIGALVRTLAAKLGVEGVAPAGEQFAWLDALVKDLQAKAGKGIVVAGDHLPEWVHALVAAINEKLTNVGANKPVKLIEPVEARADKPEQNGDLAGLVKDAAEKQVDVLLILGGANPAYSAPADLDFAGALKNVPLAVHVGSHQDETAVLCEWHINEAHPLETWGDVRGHDGTAIVQQPLIAPLFGGHSALEVLAALVPGTNGVPGSAMAPEALVAATWAKWHADNKLSGPFKTFWDAALRAGAIPGTASAAVTVPLSATATAGLPATTGPVLKDGEIELNFRPCPALFDGRHANNGWLQELPKPLTKICWDNAAFVSPKTAEQLRSKVDFRWTAGEHGRAEVNVAKITVEGKELLLPIWGLPGHADGAITVHLGHGRLRAGAYVGNNDQAQNAAGEKAHGTNVYPVRKSGALWATAAKAERTPQRYFLANNQGNWSMVERDPISGKPLDRKPVRFGTLAEYDKNPKFGKITPAAGGETEAIDANVPYPKVLKKDDDKHDDKHEHKHDKRLHPLNMYNPAEGLSPDLNPAQRRRWAMAIDLTACNGCSACVVACQSENNIPVVGKEQVTKGREMYWINVDRYYSGDEKGDPGAIRAYFQPRACVQCENAPCEIVCPVGATVHSTDGLNDMAYNRCVGTRYCSNNCPYKVRRFNFLTFQDWDTDTIKLGRNPEVSVRSRGVMEKCSFCVQRIRAAEIVAERELAKGLRKLPDPDKGEVLIRDGEVITACQAACPSAAIAFGDIADPTAVVSQWKNEPTNYGLLAELNTRPRLTYLAVVRNPNPALAK
jgi:molybdopterin-containing oxidoreductase family iron-sulfur binding subunit